MIAAAWRQSSGPKTGGHVRTLARSLAWPNRRSIFSLARDRRFKCFCGNQRTQRVEGACAGERKLGSLVALAARRQRSSPSLNGRRARGPRECSLRAPAGIRRNRLVPTMVIWVGNGSGLIAHTAFFLPLSLTPSPQKPSFAHSVSRTCRVRRRHGSDRTDRYD